MYDLGLKLANFSVKSSDLNFILFDLTMTRTTNINIRIRKCGANP